RGVNSIDNFDEILGAMHLVAGLKRNEAKELFEISLDKFRTVGHDTEEHPVLGRAARWEGFEREWRALVTYRPAEAAHASAQWEKAKAKVLPTVEEWRRGRPHVKQKVAMTKLVDLIPREYRGVFDFGVEEFLAKNAKGTEVVRYRPRCAVNPKQEATLKASFGKAAIITDLEPGELKDEDLLEASVARADIEEQFKWLKDRYVISIKPMWVWHDANVPGHMFVCVMGLTLLRYLQWEAKELRLSMKELVDRLGKIRLAVVMNEEGRLKWVLEEMGLEEADLVKRFELLNEMPGESSIAA
ncbi:MAG: IS1634 family transposase, partial [Nitrososphaerales archaeon]